MHEFSVAQSIVETVLQVAEKHGATHIGAVNLEVGEVALVNVEQLEWHMRMLFQGTSAERAEIRWNHIPAQIRCLQCGHEGTLGNPEGEEKSHFVAPSFECPSCQSPQTVITSGRELRIVDISAGFPENEEESADA